MPGLAPALGYLADGSTLVDFDRHQKEAHLASSCIEAANGVGNSRPPGNGKDLLEHPVDLMADPDRSIDVTPISISMAPAADCLRVRIDRNGTDRAGFRSPIIVSSHILEAPSDCRLLLDLWSSGTRSRPALP